MFETLSQIGKKLNDNQILWAVGASILLVQHGMADAPNDIDIFVSLQDIKKADRILQSMGQKKSREKTDDYETRYFYEYTIHSIDLDVMAGLAIRHESGVFEYLFDQQSITQSFLFQGVEIPFTSLEDWYVLYQLIPGRESKVRMLEDRLTAMGIQHPDLLKRALRGNLPDHVRARILQLMTVNS